MANRELMPIISKTEMSSSHLAQVNHILEEVQDIIAELSVIFEKNMENRRENQKTTVGQMLS